MKNSLKMLASGFESSSENTKEFQIFYMTFRKEFGNQLKSIGAGNVKFHRGHFSVSGFYTLKEQCWYFDLSDVRNNRESLMFRKVKDYNDYTGESNRWVLLSKDVAKQMHSTDLEIQDLVCVQTVQCSGDVIRDVYLLPNDVYIYDHFVSPKSVFKKSYSYTVIDLTVPLNDTYILSIANKYHNKVTFVNWYEPDGFGMLLFEGDNHFEHACKMALKEKEIISKYSLSMQTKCSSQISIEGVC